MTNTLSPIDDAKGTSKKYTVNASYSKIVAILGEPNIDYEFDIVACWGFEDSKGRKAWLWAMDPVISLVVNDSWSADGDVDLLGELFGTKNVSGKYATS